MPEKLLINNGDDVFCHFYSFFVYLLQLYYNLNNKINGDDVFYYFHWFFVYFLQFLHRFKLKYLKKIIKITKYITPIIYKILIIDKFF